MTPKRPYPTDVAREVSLRRPDLAQDDAIAAVLTSDPTLTADEVIEILDDATADYISDIGRAILPPAPRGTVGRRSR